MEVPDGGDDLVEDGPGLPLREELLAHDLVEELPAAHELKDEADLEDGTDISGYKGFGYMEFPAIWDIFGWSGTEWDFIQ